MIFRIFVGVLLALLFFRFLPLIVAVLLVMSGAV